MPHAIVTGGSGFVGSHLVTQLLKSDRYDKIINVDLKPSEISAHETSDRYVYLQKDIREELSPELFKEQGCGSNSVIFNLAAICKIPGYPDADYFHTNIEGAKNVCRLAEELGCDKMVFTSSISPYGASEEVKTETSVPEPKDPYGSSKLAAEYIHRGWYEKDPQNHRLTILRPGIIFGPRERANFTRLYTSLKKHFFAYPGRRDTRKACIYVKDVARACRYFADGSAGLELYNLVYEEPPTIEQICEVIHEQTDAGKARLLIPSMLLLGAAHAIRLLGKLIGKEFVGIHPDRVKKVMISTNVSGAKLAESPFDLKYSLSEGVADWYQECEGTLA